MLSAFSSSCVHSFSTISLAFSWISSGLLLAGWLCFERVDLPAKVAYERGVGVLVLDRVLLDGLGVGREAQRAQ